VFPAVWFYFRYSFSSRLNTDLYSAMKQKKAKCRQVSVYSSLASESGPQPVIKVKKHFEAAREINSSSHRDDTPTRPKLVKKLPSFITDDVEEQEEEEEHLQVQQQILKPEPQESKREW
jgi:t-SNARE complex subunit (syntaxin)